MAGEKTSTHDAGGPEAPVSVGWLILPRLGDLKEGQGRLETRFERLDSKLDTQIGELLREFDSNLTRTSNSQILAGVLGFLGVIATLVAVLIKVR